MQRIAGFYRVKFRGHWIIAKWSPPSGSTVGFWSVPGNNDYFVDNELAVIDDTHVIDPEPVKNWLEPASAGDPLNPKKDKFTFDIRIDNVGPPKMPFAFETRGVPHLSKVLQAAAKLAYSMHPTAAAHYRDQDEREARYKRMSEIAGFKITTEAQYNLAAVGAPKDIAEAGRMDVHDYLLAEHSRLAFTAEETKIMQSWKL